MKQPTAQEKYINFDQPVFVKVEVFKNVGKVLYFFSAIFDLDIRLVDEERNPVAGDETGEICFYNPYCRGYINREEENRIHFSDGYFYTGDLAVYKDGQMVFQYHYDRKYFSDEHANDFVALLKNTGDELLKGNVPMYALDQ